MAKRKYPFHDRRPAREDSDSAAANRRDSANQVALRRNSSGAWEFVQPRCVQERELDLADVEEMLEADEIEIAREELRWLLDGCPDNMGVHFRLGDLALAEKDYRLARGHYGYAYQIGHKAIMRAKPPRHTGAWPPSVPRSAPANELFFAAGKQLVWCLKLLEKPELLHEVVEFLLACDPDDPDHLRALL
ncbi:MAG: hypothetical protein SFX18_16780 [Pirellulales bacterium]|nr:hypothetical protein [Pirellulales bacterium]